MDPSQYYITTLTNAALKIGPLLGYLVVGYFIFFKLPFLFLLRNMKQQKNDLRPDMQVNLEKKLESGLSEKIKIEHKAGQHKERKEQKPKEENTQQAKKEQKAEIKKELPLTAEAALFKFTANEVITKDELRKRYHDLLKQTHPDKVAALDPDFKKLADKKTKEINAAYAKLKKTAA